MGVGSSGKSGPQHAEIKNNKEKKIIDLRILHMHGVDIIKNNIPDNIMCTNKLMYDLLLVLSDNREFVFKPYLCIFAKLYSVSF